MGLSISTTNTTHKLEIKRDRRRQQIQNRNKVRHRKNVIAQENMNPENVVTVNKQNIQIPQTNKLNTNMGNSRIEKKPIGSSLTNDHQIMVGDNAYEIKILKQMKQTNNTNEYLKTDQEKYQPYKYKANNYTQLTKTPYNNNPQSNQQITILKNSNFTHSTNVNSNYHGHSNTQQYTQRPTSIQDSRRSNMQKQRSNSNLEMSPNIFNSPKENNDQVQLQTARINSIQQTRKDLQEIQNRKRKDIVSTYQRNQGNTPKLSNNVYQGRSGSKSSFVKDNVSVEIISSRDIQSNMKNQQKIKLKTQQVQIQQNPILTKRKSSQSINKYKFQQQRSRQKKVKDTKLNKSNSKSSQLSPGINKIKVGTNSNSNNSNKIKVK